MTTENNIEDYIKHYADLTIADLDFIIRNNHKHTKEQVIAAEHTIKNKRIEWKAKNTDTAIKIDELIRKQGWFDFHVLSFDGNKLIVGGSIDLTYYHSLEIIFDDVFFVSGFFGGWHSDTDKAVFQIPDKEKDLNIKYEIEQDYQLFTFKTEDFENDIIIAANNVSFNTDTVFYYDRPDLKLNERIADFVKNKNAP